jgi:hypothetical protein
MSVSSCHLLSVAFIPGAMEIENTQAVLQANFAWAGLTLGVMQARNMTYINLALTTITAIGATLITPVGIGTGILIGSLAVASLLFGAMSIVAIKKLYENTMQYKNALILRQTMDG